MRSEEDLSNCQYCLISGIGEGARVKQAGLQLLTSGGRFTPGCDSKQGGWTRSRRGYDTLPLQDPLQLSAPPHLLKVMQTPKTAPAVGDRRFKHMSL